MEGFEVGSGQEEARNSQRSWPLSGIHHKQGPLAECLGPWQEGGGWVKGLHY